MNSTASDSRSTSYQQAINSEKNHSNFQTKTKVTESSSPSLHTNRLQRKFSNQTHKSTLQYGIEPYSNCQIVECNTFSEKGYNQEKKMHSNLSPNSEYQQQACKQKKLKTVDIDFETFSQVDSFTVENEKLNIDSDQQSSFEENSGLSNLKKGQSINQELEQLLKSNRVVLKDPTQIQSSQEEISDNSDLELSPQNKQIIENIPRIEYQHFGEDKILQMVNIPLELIMQQEIQSYGKQSIDNQRKSSIQMKASIDILEIKNGILTESLQKNSLDLRQIHKRKSQLSINQSLNLSKQLYKQQPYKKQTTFQQQKNIRNLEQDRNLAKQRQEQPENSIAQQDSLEFSKQFAQNQNKEQKNQTNLFGQDKNQSFQIQKQIDQKKDNKLTQQIGLSVLDQSTNTQNDQYKRIDTKQSNKEKTSYLNDKQLENSSQVFRARNQQNIKIKSKWISFSKIILTAVFIFLLLRLIGCHLNVCQY